MSTQLMTTITLHTYLVLISGTLFYATLLEAANRHNVRKNRLNSLSFFALVFAVLAWGSKLFLLRDYFDGTLGFKTEAALANNIGLFSLIQVYAFPVVILFGIMLFFIIWKEGHLIAEKEAVRKAVLIFSFLGFALSAILMFLGVLLP